MRGLSRVGARIAFALVVFVALALAITARPAKRLIDFDQTFYLTIAYDLDRHGVFSNGIFDATDSTRAPPPPGMFFSPLYPWVVLGVMKLDPRFARAVTCAIEANEKHRDLGTCEIYAFPMHLAHALLLALGVLAIGFAGEIILARRAVFYLAGSLATAGLALETDLFSYIMTESVAFALFSLAGLALVLALKTARGLAWGAAGLTVGIACLARPSYLILVPVGLVLIAVQARWLARIPAAAGLRHMLAFALAAAIVLTPWLARNYRSVGKLGFTEEYGAVSLIERFAFNRMTAREYFLAFPYCVPVVGPAVVDRIAGPDAMARFTWSHAGSFFELGRARRVALVEAHTRLDPIMGELTREEMRHDWWRHLATTIPLAWCGLWVSGVWSLILLPLFAGAVVTALRPPKPLFLLYAVPALVLVGVHGVLANHYPRYNLGLIGPIAIGAAWIIVRAADAVRARRVVTSPAKPASRS